MQSGITEADWFRCKAPGCGATLEEKEYLPGITFDIIRYACPKCKEPHRRVLFSDYNNSSIPGNIAKPESRRFEEASTERYLWYLDEKLRAEKCVGVSYSTDQHPYSNGLTVTSEHDIMAPDYRARSEAVEDLILFFKVTGNEKAKERLDRLWNSSSHSDGIFSDDKKEVGKALGVTGFKLWWRTLF